MKTMLLTGLVGLALTASATAQTSTTVVQQSPQSIEQFNGPVEHYTLNYATGVLTKDSNDSYSQVGVNAVSVTAYDNTCTFGSFAGVGVEEWIDWGVKAAGASGIVDSFDFAYATDAIDISLAGPGATLEVAIYEGNLGGGVLGTLVDRFAFTGLPGSDGTGFFGFLITVDLVGGSEICLPDGPIGYGFCSSDPGTTGPFLVDVVACAANGVVDLFDIYACPAAVSNYVGTFAFGTVGIASFFIDITEDDGSELATTAVNNGAGGNMLLLSDGGVPPTIGDLWPLTADTGVTGHAMSVCRWYTASLPAGTTFFNGTEIIIDPTSLVDFENIVAGTGSNDHSVTVPKDLTLVGADYTVQAFYFGGGPSVIFTNAIDVHVGF